MSVDPQALGQLVEPCAPAVAAAPTTAARTRRVPMPLLGLILPLGVLVLGEVAVRQGWISPNLLPAPSDVLRTLLELGAQGLATHVLASSARVAAGFAIGGGLALAVGAAVGLSRRVEALLDPSCQALRAIPSLAWVPLLLLWLGIDEASKVVLIAIGAFFPVYMGVASGFRDVDRKLVEVARMHRLSQAALVRRVLLPAALPAVLTGLRNGLSLAWMFMVAAELIAASQGLGYLLTDGRETSRADIVLAAIVLLAVLGKASDTAMQALERRLLAWRDSFDNTRA
ncbi:ABC transporter permease [Methylibium petroleiphilum]|uniref:ABC transporter permease n=1 Tax=Methylibium petroleiphilum TaxID=105560 RepID=UPI001AD33B71|nr:ABC transporter permease [Methylibium petroleiphilum]MBN9205175.1 ABC transporter permease [Methylibium petroleiphilum]